jgi:transposase
VDFEGDIKALLELLRWQYKQIESQRKQIESQCKEIELLKNRTLELERQLGLDSTNSSKPPSSDGLKKKPKPPRTTSSREKGKRTSGGQTGHKGHTLEQVEDPDTTIRHEVTCCEKCQKDLSKVKARRIIKRQVFDIPEPTMEVTEHQVEEKVCSCGHCNKSKFPEGINAPAQYGDRIKAMAVYFNVQQFIPEDRLDQVFADIFNFSISTATLMSMVSNFSKKVEPIQKEVLAKLKAAPVKNLDESGLRVNKKLYWVHSISNEKYTHYRIDPHRGSVLTDITKGTMVHDGFKSYLGIGDVVHALCNAHHLRELKALETIDKEPWAKTFGQLLKTANCMANMTRVTGSLLELISGMYDRLVDEGLKFHRLKPAFKNSGRARRPGHNLLLRLLKYKDWVLRFLTDPEVPFTNNQAERDIRMTKLKQKISGGFRTEEGAKVFCMVRGFLSTCRKQDYNIFQAIQQIINGQTISFSGS